MITRLEIENFYSIGAPVLLDLTTGPKTPEEPGRLVQTHSNSKLRAPRVLTVFGPNAAGKSNVLRALAFLGWFIQHSFQHPANKHLPFHKFSSKERMTAPTRLSITFEGLEDPLSSEGPTCLYTYSVQFDGRTAGGDRVLSETLHYQPADATRPRRVFYRDANGNVKTGAMLSKSPDMGMINFVLRQDASLISTLAQFNNPLAQAMVQAANSIHTNLFMTRVERDSSLTQDFYASKPELLAALNRDIRRLDLGIDQIEITQRQGKNHAIFMHYGLDYPIDMALESHGTQQFVNIFPMLYMVLQSGGIAVIDELDTAIHPWIVPEIIRWFWDPDRNPHGAQLWTSCHTVSLLDDLLKEEVILCSKEMDGNTEAYRLADIKGLRRGDNLTAKYMSGVYGAVPVIG